jgi:hypothetical protein
MRRPRLWGAAVVGGLGFAAGRASKRSAEADQSAANTTSTSASPDLAVKLKELADLHSSGALTDAEFAAAKAKLLGD